jgi:hypothetical protein
MLPMESEVICNTMLNPAARLHPMVTGHSALPCNHVAAVSCTIPAVSITFSAKGGTGFSSSSKSVHANNPGCMLRIVYTNFQDLYRLGASDFCAKHSVACFKCLYH